MLGKKCIMREGGPVVTYRAITTAWRRYCVRSIIDRHSTLMGNEDHYAPSINRRASCFSNATSPLSFSSTEPPLRNPQHLQVCIFWICINDSDHNVALDCTFKTTNLWKEQPVNKHKSFVCLIASEAAKVEIFLNTFYTQETSAYNIVNSGTPVITSTRLAWSA